MTEPANAKDRNEAYIELLGELLRRMERLEELITNVRDSNDHLGAMLVEIATSLDEWSFSTDDVEEGQG